MDVKLALRVAVLEKLRPGLIINDDKGRHGLIKACDWEDGGITIEVQTLKGETTRIRLRMIDDGKDPQDPPKLGSTLPEGS